MRNVRHHINHVESFPLLFSLTCIGAICADSYRVPQLLSRTVAVLFVAAVLLVSFASHAQTERLIVPATAKSTTSGATQTNLGSASSTFGASDATTAEFLRQTTPSMVQSTALDATKAGASASLDTPKTTAPVAPKAPQPSQFQRFVQKSTGRMLPVFGSELFEGAPSYTADAALPAPAEYILGPGDEVRL